MAVKKKPMPGKKKYFTPEQANAMLPLVRAIVRDITELAHDLRDRHERLTRLRPKDGAGLSDAHREEMDQARAAIDVGKVRMTGLEKELTELGIELKDYFTGLIDFPSWMDGREVLLCWRHGEPDVGHWHEVDAGFANR